MKVNARSRDLLFKELPWMEDFLPLDAVEFNVKLIDLDTLSLNANAVRLESGEWFQVGRILLFNDSGEMIGEVGTYERYLMDKKWSWRKFRQIEKVTAKVVDASGETIELAIRRLSPQSKRIRFVVYYSRHSNASVVIYKVPNRIIDLETWLNEKAAEETRNLRNVLEETDSEV